jgi:hypothetical protein
VIRDKYQIATKSFPKFIPLRSINGNTEIIRFDEDTVIVLDEPSLDFSYDIISKLVWKGFPSCLFRSTILDKLSEISLSKMHYSLAYLLYELAREESLKSDYVVDSAEEDIRFSTNVTFKCYLMFSICHEYGHFLAINSPIGKAEREEASNFLHKYCIEQKFEQYDSVFRSYNTPIVGRRKQSIKLNDVSPEGKHAHELAADKIGFDIFISVLTKHWGFEKNFDLWQSISTILIARINDSKFKASANRMISDYWSLLNNKNNETLRSITALDIDEIVDEPIWRSRYISYQLTKMAGSDGAKELAIAFVHHEQRRNFIAYFVTDEMLPIANFLMSTLQNRPLTKNILDMDLSRDNIKSIQDCFRNI